MVPSFCYLKYLKLGGKNVVAMECVFFPFCDVHFEVYRSVKCLAVFFSARNTEIERQGRQKFFTLRIATC